MSDDNRAWLLFVLVVAGALAAMCSGCISRMVPKVDPVIGGISIFGDINTTVTSTQSGTVESATDATVRDVAADLDLPAPGSLSQ
tara:strand:- start:19 stop:273 length:255 start_codon:yes stop_codon:yes gene_type:complete